MIVKQDVIGKYDKIKKEDTMEAISKRIGENQYAGIGVTCTDCGKEFVLEIERIGPDSIEIKSGAIGKRNDGYLFKCHECWEADQNFGEITEVYSRVVGYLRPVSQWNNAKQAEHGLRKFYNIPYIEK